MIYDGSLIAFDDFKTEMKGKFFLLCDTDDKLEANTNHIKNDAQHPKLKYRRLIINENNESADLVEVNSTVASKSTVLEDVLNGITFIDTLDDLRQEYPELDKIISESNRVDMVQHNYYPSSLSLKLSVPENRELKSFFKKHSNHMKVIFALKYLQNVKNKEEIPWVNEIRNFFNA